MKTSEPPGADDRLIAAAVAARARAHAPYSGYRVGAAIETEDEVIVTGCNIENASYGLTMCAERVALFTAVSEGHRRFRRIAIAGGGAEPAPPCGACRQLLWEFGGDLEVVMASPGGVARQSLSHLLPLPFDDRLIK